MGLFPQNVRLCRNCAPIHPTATHAKSTGRVDLACVAVEWMNLHEDEPTAQALIKKTVVNTIHHFMSSI